MKRCIMENNKQGIITYSCTSVFLPLRRVLATQALCYFPVQPPPGSSPVAGSCGACSASAGWAVAMGWSLAVRRPCHGKARSCHQECHRQPWSTEWRQASPRDLQSSQIGLPRWECGESHGWCEGTVWGRRCDTVQPRHGWSWSRLLDASGAVAAALFGGDGLALPVWAALSACGSVGVGLVVADVWVSLSSSAAATPG